MDDLASVVGDEPAIVVGHSLGGVVALAFASRHPQLAPAVVAYEAPMPWLTSWPSNTAGGVALAESGDAADAAEHFMRRIVGDDRWEALPARTQGRSAAPRGPRWSPSSARCARRTPLRTTSRRFPVPVVAGHGGGSRPHHQEAARTLAPRCPAGRAGGDRRRVARRPPQPPEEFADLVRRAAALERPRGRIADGTDVLRDRHSQSGSSSGPVDVDDRDDARGGPGRFRHRA